jgi:GNAT superfamily N-acetyltransferase
LTTSGTLFRMSPEPIAIRPIDPRDLTWVREELIRNWGSTQICSLDRWYDADTLPGFIATRRDGVARIGLLTHTPPERGGGCEVITLSSQLENAGVGARLLAAAIETARSAGCSRIFLTTTNDNLRALGFYQKRGWHLVAVHAGAMDRARQIKPSIPLMGMNGIPLRDELELETKLTERP